MHPEFLDNRDLQNASIYVTVTCMRITENIILSLDLFHLTTLMHNSFIH